MTKSFIISLIITASLISCKEKASPGSNQSPGDETEGIVAGIARENVLMGPAVGIAGTRSKQWERYEALLTKVSDKDLIAYTNHENPTVRCYSFDALVARKNPNSFQILLKHLNDTAEVETLFGCTGVSQPVAEYFLQTSKNMNLSFGQKQILDSILVFDKEVIINEKYSILDSLKKETKYYERIKEMILEENDFKAVPVLAKYKKSGDVSIITGLLRSSDNYKQYYGLLSVVNYPHPMFFPELEQIISRQNSLNIKYSYETDLIRRALYSAIIQYKNLSARRLLEKELQSAKGQDLITKTDLIFQSLKQYPDSIYIGVINFNFYN